MYGVEYIETVLESYEGLINDFLRTRLAMTVTQRTSHLHATEWRVKSSSPIDHETAKKIVKASVRLADAMRKNVNCLRDDDTTMLEEREKCVKENGLWLGAAIDYLGTKTGHAAGRNHSAEDELEELVVECQYDDDGKVKTVKRDLVWRLINPWYAS